MSVQPPKRDVIDVPPGGERYEGGGEDTNGSPGHARGAKPPSDCDSPQDITGPRSSSTRTGAEHEALYGDSLGRG